MENLNLENGEVLEGVTVRFDVAEPKFERRSVKVCQDLIMDLIVHWAS